MLDQRARLETVSLGPEVNLSDEDDDDSQNDIQITQEEEE